MFFGSFNNCSKSWSASRCSSLRDWASWVLNGESPGVLAEKPVGLASPDANSSAFTAADGAATTAMTEPSPSKRDQRRERAVPRAGSELAPPTTGLFGHSLMLKSVYSASVMRNQRSKIPEHNKPFSESASRVVGEGSGVRRRIGPSLRRSIIRPENDKIGGNEEMTAIRRRCRGVECQARH